MKEWKTIRPGLKIITAAFFIVVTGYFVFNSILQKKIRQQLKDISPALQINFSAIHTNIFASSVSFDSLDINFTPYKNRPQNKHHLYFPKASVTGIHFLKFLFSKKLAANNLFLEEGTLQIDSFLIEKKDSVQQDILKEIKWPFKQLAIRSVVLKKIKIFDHAQTDQLIAAGNISFGGISINKDGDTPAFEAVDLDLSELNYSFHDYKIHMPRLIVSSANKKLEIDSLEVISTGHIQAKVIVSAIRITGLDIIKSINQQILVTKKIAMGEVKIEVNHYHIEITNAELDNKEDLIQIRNINVIPQLDKYEFGKRLGHQADRFQAYISSIKIIKPDIPKLFQQKLYAEKIKISESKAYIFRDRRLPRPQKFIPLPGDYIRQLPVDIRVNSCELANATVEYEEYPKSGYGKTGILRIEKFNSSLSPFINRPLPSDPSFITMNVEGSIMGSGTSHCIVMMPLQKNKPYHIKGEIEKLELTKLNSSSENLGKIRIKSGFLDFLFFDFTMTEQRSTGKIIGAYHHLIIQPFKKHKEKKDVADFASFMVRHFIIPLNKDASLPENKRTGFVNYKRDPTRMVSYYFLQSLLMGIKKSFKLGFLLPK